VFVIFGATGDLMAKKIAPALFHLYRNGKFPKMFRIIAFSRRNLQLSEFQDHIRQILIKHKAKGIKSEDIESFLNYFIYQKGDFDTVKSYNELASFLGHIDGEWKAC